MSASEQEISCTGTANLYSPLAQAQKFVTTVAEVSEVHSFDPEVSPKFPPDIDTKTF